MGRPNSPAALKLLTGRRPGTDSGGRRVEMGPAFVRTAPNPPSWLGREARAEWRRIVPELDRLKLLSRVTRASLAAYCQTWEAFVRAVGIVADEGMVVETHTVDKDGNVVRTTILRHPAVAIQLAASTELRRWAVEYGLTPASEQKVKTPKGGDDDDDLLD